jgi:hypothetical protein
MVVLMRVAVAALLLALAPACFTPDQPPCAFSCATPPQTCPAGYTCGADLICHNDSNPGACDLSVDAGTDATSD